MLLCLYKTNLSKHYLNKYIAAKETMIFEFSNPLIQLFLVLLIVLITLFGTQWLKNRLGLPKIIGYILAGLLIGPSGLTTLLALTV